MLKETMGELVDFTMERDRNVEEGKFPGNLYDDGWFYQEHALTRGEADAVLGMPKDSKPYFSTEGDEIIRIVNEEAPAYYTGQKPVEEVAKVIQSRVRLYVMESKK